MTLFSQSDSTSRKSTDTLQLKVRPHERFFAVFSRRPIPSAAISKPRSATRGFFLTRSVICFCLLMQQSGEFKQLFCETFDTLEVYIKVECLSIRAITAAVIQFHSGAMAGRMTPFCNSDSTSRERTATLQLKLN
ncbi:hypothetical protein AVEN_96371-1 [Araneus ventricosus]|uniref:Uncharacterized protein n=1 Tax=Araneus ventricosus TaxID=182803 RepID=A0A4Y2MX57_ARAVE|nr:hypothetical protein AVEN_96371-1 [Araneus ventricosus]